MNDERLLQYNYNVRPGKLLTSPVETADLKNMPMFYRSGIDYAYGLGGPLMRAIIDAMPITGKFKYLSLDSRTHMLMQGMYPCIPGWHCDDWYRAASGQPDLWAVGEGETHESVNHMIVLGDCSLTEFLYPCCIELVSPQSPSVYGEYHRMIEERKLSRYSIADNRIYTFNAWAFHRGMPATKNGWRTFVRLTESNHREPKNEIRTHTQTYLLSEENGW